MAFFSHLLGNKVLLVAMAAWALAQILKVIILLVKERRLDLHRLIGSGGMPSSHSALVTALAVSVGQEDGWNSTIAAVTVVFALIVMYDAAGVRRAAGKQARVLNRLIEDYFQHHAVSEEHLKELIGHTPIQVFMGALLGIFIALLFS